ncbi:hypothetical protein CM15mP43_00410 [bacterium]|nr:MAG: hypothetical protein CM15mP43_00410 [bacterium]
MVSASLPAFIAFKKSELLDVPLSLSNKNSIDSFGLIGFKTFLSSHILVRSSCVMSNSSFLVPDFCKSIAG